MENSQMKTVYDRSLPMLIENLVLEEVLVHLRSREILKEQDENEINAKNTPTCRITHLVGLLKRNPSKSYDPFLKVLKNTNQRHIAGEMERTAVKVRNGELHEEDQVDGLHADTFDGPPDSVEELFSCKKWTEPIIHALPDILEYLELMPLLTHLRSKRHFSENECHSIEAGKTPYERNKMFVSYLIKKSEPVYQDVKVILRIVNQPHVANLFEGKGTSEDRQSFTEPARPSCKMSDWHKKLLDKHYEDLVECMDPKLIVVKLRSSMVFNRADSDNINTGETRADKVMNLLDLLMKKEDEAFNKFLDALRTDNQGHLAEPLSVQEPHRSSSLDYPEQVTSPTRSLSDQPLMNVDEVDFPSAPGAVAGSLPHSVSTEELTKRYKSLKLDIKAASDAIPVCKRQNKPDSAKVALTVESTIHPRE